MEKPKFLYKYRPVYSEQQKGFVKNILLEHKFFFAPPSFFYDPYEFRFLISKDDSYEDKMEWLTNKLRVENPEIEMSLLREKAKSFFDTAFNNEFNFSELNLASEYLSPNFDKKVGILSLSETFNNMLMWSYYADWHRGICMGFEFSEGCDFFGRAERVNYLADYPNLNLLKKYSLEDGLGSRFYKSELWSHEKEWRIVESGAAEEYRLYPSNKLSQIIFGCQTSKNTIEEVKEWLSQLKNSNTIQLKQARVGNTMYEIVVEDL